MQQREELISSIYEAMSATKRSMHNRMHAIIGDSPISRTQLELLIMLKHLQPISPKKLADNMHLTPGAISQLVDGLVDLDLVSREVDPSDRRLQILKLSDRGTDQLSTMEKNRHEMLKHVMDDMTREELLLLLKIQQKMVAQLDTIEKKQTIKGDK